MNQRAIELLFIRIGVRILSATMVKPTAVAARFATGRPLVGGEKTDATWLRPGTHAADGVRTIGRWSYRPGWQRMLIRWAFLAALVAFMAGQAASPWLTNTLMVVGLVALVVARVRRARQDAGARRHTREVVMPVWEVVAQYLKLAPNTSPEGYLSVPADVEEPGARVDLVLPRGWDADEASQARVDGVMRRLVHPRLVAEWEPMLRRASWHLEPLSEHAAKNIQPMYETLANLLGMDPNMRGDRWIELPEDFEEADETKVRITLPDGVDIDTKKQQRIDSIVRRYLGRNIHGSWTSKTVEYTKKGTPPPFVKYAGHDDPIDVIKLAKDGAGKWLEIRLASETPHGFVTAPTTWGKSSALTVPAAHVRSKGGLVGNIDPKRNSYKDTLQGVPGVRVHATIESFAWALEEFFVSMLGVEIAVENGADPEDFPVRLLNIDEFGSMMTMLDSWWKRKKGRKEVEGDPPFRDQFNMIAWRGRANRHFIQIGTHQPSLKLFGSTDVRGQFGWRVILGSFDTSIWRTTFGNAPRVAWNGRKKGRGVVGFGETEDEIYEAQIVRLEDDEARELASSGPPPPDWFINGEIAPWITEEALDEAREAAGVSRLSLPGTDRGYAGLTTQDDPRTPDLGGTPTPTSLPPAEMHREPSGEWTEESAETSRGPLELVLPDTSGSSDSEPADVSVKNTRSEMRPVAEINPDLIIGNRAAAEFLGMTQDNFVRQRRRYKKKHGRMPGERMATDGKPCWTKEALRQWQSSRPIAGPAWAAHHDEQELG